MAAGDFGNAESTGSCRRTARGTVRVERHDAEALELEPQEAARDQADAVRGVLAVLRAVRHVHDQARRARRGRPASAAA